MKHTRLPVAAEDAVDLLISMNLRPDSIWLAGSRANGRATTTSDTDLFVFASFVYLDALRVMTPCIDTVDVLVVCDGNHFEDPWKGKKGSIEEWQWRQRSEGCATYTGRKFIPDVGDEVDDGYPLNARPSAQGCSTGTFREYSENALRIWPVDA